ncbi:nuclease [Lentibacillus populi]|uniref:Nuclease n=1 Tax=Lentibacillus populi TaxID=1827502 RepID=A0A9W5TW92_9BACI|nr:NERD domain-containing protein [Lentibacillus populi]GGB35450.1 nuclease [Lentibacillus populi]
MFTVKYRTKPYVILCYEALFRNLKEGYRTHRKLTEDFNRFNAGYRGEKDVDYNLSLFPHKNFYIFHNIRLKIHNKNFQIDTLIVSKTFLCIVEIKNLAGTIEYDPELHQLVQINGGKITAFQDPVLQAETQKMHLKAWLQQFNMSIPIETLVVSSNPSTIIKIQQDDPVIYRKLIRKESLHLHLKALTDNYTETVLSNIQIKNLNNAILSGDIPHHPNLIKQYNIQKKHLIDGIVCPSCWQTAVERINKKWTCRSCTAEIKLLHERIILDYFLLFNNTITNRQCRELLKIDSPSVMYYLLKSMKLHYVGKNSARKYLAPSIENYPQNSDYPGKHKSVFQLFD